MLQKKKTKKSFLGKRIKNAEEPKRVLFKVKPLEKIRQVKIKKPSKPVKSLIKTTVHFQPSSEKLTPINIIKPTKPKKPELVKQIESSIYKLRVKIIGIGGGGSSIISEIAPEIKKVNFVAANTDLQALKEVGKRAIHFQFGKRLTQGLGTGMNPELGEQAAQETNEKIKKILEGQDICVLISCLGGGTGSGAAPVFAKISKKLGNITLGIFTLPFEFEGEKKMEVARASLEKLRPNLNALILISNQRVFQIIDTKTPLKKALSSINKTLAQSLEGLTELFYSPGLIAIDFANFKTILTGREKLTFLNTIEAKTSNEIEEVAKKALSNPLYSYSTQGAKGILFNIAGGENLSLDGIKQIGSIISNSANPRARIIWGITQNEKYKNKIKITLLAIGCQEKECQNEKERAIKCTLCNNNFVVRKNIYE